MDAPDRDHVKPMPLQAAERRLLHARNYLRVVEPLLATEIEGQDHQFSTLLGEVLGNHGVHPQYGELGVAAALLAEERLEEARKQLPRVLFNSLLAYTVSMVEAMLAECVEAVELLTQRTAIKSNQQSAYLRRRTQLRELGLHVNLSSDLEDALSESRKRRNEVIHQDVTAANADVEAALDSAEGLLTALRGALISIEEEEDEFTQRMRAQHTRNTEQL